MLEQTLRGHPRNAHQRGWSKLFHVAPGKFRLPEPRRKKHPPAAPVIDHCLSVLAAQPLFLLRAISANRLPLRIKARLTNLLCKASRRFELALVTVQLSLTVSADAL